MLCSHCGSEQESGKFCGKCGGRFEETVNQENSAETMAAVNLSSMSEQAATTESQASTVKTSDQIEMVKTKSKLYGSYFTQYLKQPSRILVKGEQEFTNGIINIILASLLVALTLYTLVRNFTRAAFGDLDDLFMDSYSGPSFMSVFGGGFLFTIVSIVLVILSLFAISKLFGPNKSLKAMVSIYGAHLIPAVILSGAAFILILLKSNTYGSILLTIALLFILSILPLYLISSLLTKQPKGIDSLYGYILYIILFSIAFSVFVSVLADSTIGSYLDKVMFW
ncbi:CHY zinc finger protein [Cytobacillus praedii]|uniref:CHY zinc finger protein n=1 Tax=Cytobacillus praedii TaxID=1742358 RepID=UPI002E1A6A75|nr:CHY-type zinc finger protein [Cytobacillus praedii]